MFELTAGPILPATPPHIHMHAGAVVTFEGRVRALNEDKIVTRLDYEIYPALALSEGNKIVAEALDIFGLFDAYAVHRSGSLAVGELAVWVRCVSMHRKEAFAAAEYLVQQIKHRVPIWKKEWYRDGASAWVKCHHMESP